MLRFASMYRCSSRYRDGHGCTLGQECIYEQKCIYGDEWTCGHRCTNGHSCTNGHGCTCIYGCATKTFFFFPLQFCPAKFQTWAISRSEVKLMNVGSYHKIFFSFFWLIINLNIYKIPRFLVIRQLWFRWLLFLFSAVKMQSLRSNTALLTIVVRSFFLLHQSERGSRYSLVTTARWPEPLHVDSRTPLKFLCSRLASLTALRHDITQIHNLEENINIWWF